MAFVKALARQNAARFLVYRCKLRRVDTGGVVRSQRNLMLECELPWVTATPGAATEKKP
jgi:hypothetical protein